MDGQTWRETANCIEEVSLEEHQISTAGHSKVTTVSQSSLLLPSLRTHSPKPASSSLINFVPANLAPNATQAASQSMLLALLGQRQLPNSVDHHPLSNP